MERKTTTYDRPPPVDKDPARRPGVPMYGAAPDRTGLIRRPPLDAQPPRAPVLVGVEVGRLTPVFGDTVPPRGLSGLLRRRAYRIPEHSAARWMLLIFADRVDVWESRARRHPIATALIVAALAGLSSRGARKRRTVASRGAVRRRLRLAGVLP
jgi:hypothetical protein